MGPDSDEMPDLRTEAERYPWYHSIDLGHGVVTKGMFDHRPVLDRYPIPPDLTGKRCLDVATMDGYWAFEMERRRAASVTAIDIDDPEDLDWPASLRPQHDRSLDETKAERFALAKAALGSRVERTILSAYDLSPELGRFDFVFCGDLLLHLKDPITPVENIRSVCTGSAVIVNVIKRFRFRESRPFADLDGVDTFTWWTTNMAGLVRIVQAAGFERVARRALRAALPLRRRLAGPTRRRARLRLAAGHADAPIGRVAGGLNCDEPLRRTRCRTRRRSPRTRGPAAARSRASTTAGPGRAGGARHRADAYQRGSHPDYTRGMSEARRFWDRRADEDAFFAVDSRLEPGNPDLHRFWAEGAKDLDSLLRLGGVEIAPTDQIVEIGCGVGRLTRELAGRAASVSALDVSERMLETARRYNPGLESVSWLLGDGASLEGIPSASMDGAVSHVVFQHIPDPKVTYSYVREIGRVLRPGGWAVFQVSNDPLVHRPAGRMARLRAVARQTLRSRGPWHENPFWLGSHVELTALRSAAADGSMAVESVRGEGSQYCVVRTRRLGRGNRAE